MLNLSCGTEYGRLVVQYYIILPCSDVKLSISWIFMVVFGQKTWQHSNHILMKQKHIFLSMDCFSWENLQRKNQGVFDHQAGRSSKAQLRPGWKRKPLLDGNKCRQGACCVSVGTNAVNKKNVFMKYVEVFVMIQYGDQVLLLRRNAEEQQWLLGIILDTTSI